MMRRYVVLGLAALALAIAAPSTFATVVKRHVIFDPPPPVACAYNKPCAILELNQPYQVKFLPCTTLPDGANVPDSLDKASNGCLWMSNVSVGAANTFTFTFSSFSPGAAGDELECSSSPSSLATADCPATVPTGGAPLTLSFFANPAISTNRVFYLFTDFATPNSNATVTLSVPEPGELGLFGLGLLAIGVGFGWQKRRQKARNNLTT